ncbi:MAG: ATP-binding protein [Acidimicrobiia bacterium]
MPIRVRLALSFALVTLVLVVAAGLLFERSFRDGLKSSLEPGLRARAAAFSQSIERGEVPSRLAGNAETALLPNGDLVAQLLEPGGRVVAATREAGTRPVVPASTLRRAADEQFVDVTIGGEREPYRALARRTTTAAGERVVVVATSLESTNAAVTRVRNAVLVGGAFAVGIAAIGGWLLATAALRPVERMRRKAAEISEHDSSSRLPVPATHDEIAALATTMNQLLAELHTALARQRAFVSDAGHELRTPLAVLRAELELAGRPHRSTEQLQDAIEHAGVETDRLARLTEDLLFLAHRDDGIDPHFEATPLVDVLARATDARRARADQRNVHLRLEADSTVSARVAPDLLQLAIDNLLANAVRYSTPGTVVTVRLRRDDGAAAIEVLDEGPGFPPEFLPHAFERFRRADESRARADGGTGLGLAIVRSVAEVHGGTAVAGNRPGGGAVVTVRIPVTM